MNTALAQIIIRLWPPHHAAVRDVLWVETAEYCCLFGARVPTSGRYGISYA